jgi:hypothetical protein
VAGLVSVAMITEVGNGANTFFWKDKWLDGRGVQDIAPLVAAMVPKRSLNKRTVSEALIEEKWVEDIPGGEIDMAALTQYLELWDILNSVELNEDIPNRHIWRFSSSGQYAAKSAYDTLFQGAISFEPFERIWKSWAPPKCRFFMWLATHNRCWTADRLARRGLPHPEQCLLCDQHEENIHHLLVGCVFSREFWFSLLSHYGVAALAPQPSDQSFDDWWRKVDEAASGDVRKGLNSLVILGAWTIWRHRNDCVFNGIVPNVNVALRLARDEAYCWIPAGAKGFSLLTAGGAV